MVTQLIHELMYKVYDILIAFNYPLCIWLSCSDHHPANMIGQFHYPTLCLLGEISRNQLKRNGVSKAST
jgi:hypothetical protein